MNEEFNDDDLFEVVDTHSAFEHFRKSNEFLSCYTSQELLEKYETLYPRENGTLYLSVNRIGKLVDSLISDNLHTLIQQGLVDYAFDDRINDFVFKLKE